MADILEENRLVGGDKGNKRKDIFIRVELYAGMYSLKWIQVTTGNKFNIIKLIATIFHESHYIINM